MSIAPGTRLGVYEVVSLLGAGGMGEVYRARDTKLQRDVAIKVLPAAFAGDPDRLARFEREAQLLASLNHPNIGAIYGIEEKALILELVDGPTLADRVAQGPIPIGEALPVAKQIAEALEAAHEQGVIHRDLKPANIKLRGDGTVKVLDFGLAKLHDPNVADAGSTPSMATLSPTVMSPAVTQIGIILGTAAYMSPEQAKGKPADRRADMWAFGCVLMDDGMPTGEAVVVAESVRESTDGRAVVAAAGGTMAYDAERAFPEAEVAVLSRQGLETATFPTRGPFHTMWPSPDFRRVVVEGGSTEGGTDLWTLDGDRGSRTRLTTLAATEGHPAWSHDGRDIAYFEGVVGTRSRLMIVPATGVREPRVVVDTLTYKQVTDWSRDGRLLVFEEENPTTLYDIGVAPVDGSAPPKILIKSRFNERQASLSPDGRFLAYASTETGPSEVYVVDFPNVTQKWPVSAGGGLKPRWRRDGGELFFVTPSGALMSATVKAGGEFATGAPQKLFDIELIGSDGWDYAVSDDAQRFLALRYAGKTETSISVIANWPGVLRK